ncbi:MAG TPA: hypothetical protein VHF22_06505, partial [Planctomycetota bacterium]|nr:hypothetical protein [Planctomycetota bacterium]
KAPQYRLQIVLDQREREKKEKEEQLAETQKALRAEQKKLEAKIAERKEVDVKKERAAAAFQANIMKPGCMIGEEAERHDWYQKSLDAEAARLDQEVALQRQAVRRAEQRVEDAKQELLKAATELQAMEKHKENWQKQVKKELAEKEQMQQEEIGEAMWLAQRRKEGLREAGGGQ